MRSDSLALAVAGVCFGLIVGWIIGSQQTGRVPAAPPPPPQAASQPAAGADQANRPPLDEARVRELRQAIDRDRSDASSVVDLANVYFDAERYDDAIAWYEEGLRLRPKDVNVSTDLGVSYYYTNQADRALQQFAYSLQVDPEHTKTILNMGIVRAFGKQDLAGAAEAWRRVIDIAPESPEAQAARRALDSMRTAHPGLQGAPPPGGGG